MNYSRIRTKEANKYLISTEECAMGSLIAMGWASKDAYKVIFKPQMTLPDEYVLKRIKEITDKLEFKKFVKIKIAELKNLQVVEERPEGAEPPVPRADIPLKQKEDILKDLLDIAEGFPLHSKERADVLMKYANLQQMQKNEVKEEDTTVHYYLPLTCNNCEIYHASLTKINSNNTN